VLYSIGANTVNEGSIFSAEVQSIASVFRVEPRSDYLGGRDFYPASDFARIELYPEF
jgi:hypothetical protein